MKNKTITVGLIRRELALLIKERLATCGTDKEKNAALMSARQDINLKYGKNWRDNYPDYQSYDKWWEESNLDGSFAYNNSSDDF